MRIHRLYRPVLLVLILALSVVLLTACDPTAGHYPNQFGHGWVCDEPNIVLDNWETEDGTWHNGGEKIIMDGKEIVVQVAYHVHSVFIYPEGRSPMNPPLLYRCRRGKRASSNRSYFPGLPSRYFV